MLSLLFEAFGILVLSALLTVVIPERVPTLLVLVLIGSLIELQLLLESPTALLLARLGLLLAILILIATHST